LRLTREGRYWLITSLTLLAIGLFKGINLITFLACLLLAVWIMNWLSAWRALRRLGGERRLEEPLFAGTPTPLEVVLSNPRRRAQVGLVVEDRGPEQLLTWPVTRLPGRGSTRLCQEIVCRRRGSYPLGPLVVSTALPFGLARRSLVLADQRRVTVLPQLGRLNRGLLCRHLTQASRVLGRSRQRPRRHPTAQADLHGLRTFRSGDSPRWIHWRTTARRGELMVREFEDMPTDNLILVLDPAPPESEWRLQKVEGGQGQGTSLPAGFCLLPLGFGEDWLEEAVRMAATICWEWCRQTGGQLVLAIDGPSPLIFSGPVSRELAVRMLEALAVVEEQPPTDGTALVERLTAAGLPAAPVLLLTARPEGLAPAVTEGLRRPVAGVDVTDLSAQDFYERDGGDAH
jgi:uncharacterized protein (DUF58 family)